MMLITPPGRFITQREQPRLSLLCAEATAALLRLSAADLPGMSITHSDAQLRRRVRIWRDECTAFDAGDEIAGTLSDWLGSPCRLVRFDPEQQRLAQRSQPAHRPRSAHESIPAQHRARGPGPL